jgi:mannosyltransferase OCH1-like enzyme
MSKIPKIIHQIWFQGENIPEKYKKNYTKWKLLHPQWKYKLWTEAKMIKFFEDNIEYNTYYNDTWLHFPKMIQKIDSFKFVALDKFGGVYVDMDMEPIRPLDSLMDLNYKNSEFMIGEFKSIYKNLASLVGVRLLTNNAFIASVPQHAFNKLFFSESSLRLRSFIDRNSKELNKIGVTTGPLIVSDIVHSKGKFLNISIVPSDMVEVYNYENEKRKTGYIMHYSDCLWKEKSNLMQNLIGLYAPGTNSNPLYMILITIFASLSLLMIIALSLSVIIGGSMLLRSKNKQKKK